MNSVESSDARTALMQKYLSRYPLAGGRSYPSVLLARNANASEDSRGQSYEEKDGRKDGSGSAMRAKNENSVRPLVAQAGSPLIGKGRTVYTFRSAPGSNSASTTDVSNGETSLDEEDHREPLKASPVHFTGSTAAGYQAAENTDSVFAYLCETVTNEKVQAENRRMAVEVFWAGRDEAASEGMVFQAGNNVPIFSPYSDEVSWSLDKLWDGQQIPGMDMTEDTSKADEMFDMFIDVEKCDA